jgi:hypothetical protein
MAASIQQALPGKFIGQAAYSGILSRHLTQKNFANLSYAIDPVSGDEIRNHTGFAAVPYLTNGGISSYHGLQLGLNRHLVDNLTMTASYNFAHSIGDAQGSGEEQLPQDPMCLRCERGNNSFDVRHSLSLNAVYDLPFGRGRQQFHSGFLRALANNWSIAGSWNARTGLPLNVLIDRANEIYYSPSTQRYYSPSSSDLPSDARYVANAPYSLETIGAYRPDIVPGVNSYVKDQSSRLWLNPAAFATPEAGMFGNLGRNALRGPGFSQIDAQISRKFKRGESKHFELRAEVFNLLNHANFTNPTALLPDVAIDVQPGSSFDKGLAPGFATLNSTVGRTVGLGTSRQFQLSARFEF